MLIMSWTLLIRKVNSKSLCKELKKLRKIIQKEKVCFKNYKKENK